MDSVTVKFTKVERAGITFDVTPRYGTEGSAGCDLVAALSDPPTLAPGERSAVPTGICVHIGTPSLVGLVCARSGLALKHGISLPNGVGVIDSDYTGELLVALANASSLPYTINPGDRIAQLLFVPVERAVFEEVASLEETARGSGGFGSTGK